MDIKAQDRVRCPSGLFGRVESIRNGNACVIYETTPPWQIDPPGNPSLRRSVVEKRTVVVRADLLQPA